MSNRLDGRIAVVTGAAGAGIGSAIVRRLLDDGATVLVTDSSAGRVAQTVASLKPDFGDRVDGLKASVTEREDISAVTERAAELGGADILVNSAGTYRPAPAWEMDDETWEFNFSVTLHGTFRMSRALLPQMIEKRRGSIVNIVSSSGWVPLYEGEAAYVAAKSGQMGLTRGMAFDVGKFGVRVNAVAPGMTVNPLIARTYPVERLEDFAARTPLRRTGVPEEIADAVAFLASDEAAFITGDVLAVNGGLFMPT
jgi:3-oxoacyl-[acyl-carrier protein] reductase